MPRPSLPKAEDVASIARLLRAEGYQSFTIETTPDGGVRISTAANDATGKGSPLEEWRSKRGTS